MEDPNIAEVDQEDVAGHKFVPGGLPDWQAFFTKPKWWVRTNKNLGRILSRAVDLM